MTDMENKNTKNSAKNKDVNKGNYKLYSMYDVHNSKEDFIKYKKIFSSLRIVLLFLMLETVSYFFIFENSGTRYLELIAAILLELGLLFILSMDLKYAKFQLAFKKLQSDIEMQANITRCVTRKHNEFASKCIMNNSVAGCENNVQTEENPVSENEDADFTCTDNKENKSKNVTESEIEKKLRETINKHEDYSMRKMLMIKSFKILLFLFAVLIYITVFLLHS